MQGVPKFKLCVTLRRLALVSDRFGLLVNSDRIYYMPL
ncbi:hypothetical protein GXM_00042 [Nostoc sphaeroides CCNUC1]|uniref:Uncharacterized protein n=1 Tax=Nostoc sphaeroides CCNUC1 TaxID=2653204 RepID=A0A5P8VRM3_9NOSO|nr:hypothetical protein GXM_00042 [Nostoc sphaeroides CCNUC1]